MSKILITGGNGFIGSQLALHLLKNGHTVRILQRSDQLPLDELAEYPKLERYKGDVTDVASVEKALEGCSQVYHLAAYAKPWARTANMYYEVNVVGTKNVLDACIKYNCKDILITSSAGTFGPQIGNQLINENQISALPPFTNYEKTKLESIELAKQYLEKGLNVRFASPTRVYGPGSLSASNAATRMMLKYAQGIFRFLPGDGEGVGNYVFVEDVVKGMELIMQKGKNGENYILGGENLTYNAFIQKVGTHINKNYRIFFMPLSLLLIASKIMELMAYAFGKEPLITPPFVRKYAHNWASDLSKSRNELGYQITPFEVGIEQTFSWLKRKGHFVSNTQFKTVGKQLEGF